MKATAMAAAACSRLSGMALPRNSPVSPYVIHPFPSGRHLDLFIHLQRARCASKRRSAFLISASEFPRLRGQLPEQCAIVPLDLLTYGDRRSFFIPPVFRQLCPGFGKSFLLIVPCLPAQRNLVHGMHYTSSTFR